MAKIVRNEEEQDDAPTGRSAEKPSTARELLQAIRKSGLVGMWWDREDIADSGAFARELRRRAQLRSGD